MKNNLNLIIGEDKKLIDFYVNEILSKINYLDDNKITYNLDEYSISSILDEASMISLFADKKVIIGTNLDISKIDDNNYQYLSKYINDVNTNSYIILIASKVDARTKAYKLFKDNFNIIDISKSNNRDELIIYINKLIKDNKYKINDYDIEYFLDKVDKTITRDDINLLVIDIIDNIIYEFTNAFLDRDINKVTKMYNDFKIENVGIDYLIVSLANTLRQALIIKILANNKKSNLDMSKIIGKKEFYVKKMLERLYNYSVDDISKLISDLSDVDNDIKSGKSNIDSFEMFLINNM